jgi:hypothetical protein
LIISVLVRQKTCTIFWGRFFVSIFVKNKRSLV